jgi:hypothetical protein
VTPIKKTSGVSKAAHTMTSPGIYISLSGRHA